MIGFLKNILGNFVDVSEHFFYFSPHLSIHSSLAVPASVLYLLYRNLMLVFSALLFLRYITNLNNAVSVWISLVKIN
jgi:hypothetical protein